MSTTPPVGNDPNAFAEPVTLRVFPAESDAEEFPVPPEISEYRVLEDSEDRRRNHPFRLTEEAMRRIIGGINRLRRRRRR